MFEFFKKKVLEDSFTVSAIVVAAGSSSRMEGVNKQFIEIFDKPVIAYSLEALENSEYINEIVIVTRQEDILTISDIAKEFNLSKVTSIVPGGKTRAHSVKIGLSSVPHADLVVIHDGARPCVLTEDIDRVIQAAKIHGGAALGCKVNDTLKSVNADNMIVGTVDRAGLWQVQTPQVFRSELISAAYQGDLSGATDDCIMAERIGGVVCIVEGTPANIKVTRNDDIYIAMAILQSREA